MKRAAIVAPGYPASGPIACGSGDVTGEIEATLTPGASALTYDPATDQYVYVWDTLKGWAGRCRQLVLKLRDGTRHRASFKQK